MAGETVRQFREWFWRPPRAHGEIIRDRTVSPLELLYDLVYVAVISQAAHSLGHDVSLKHAAEFAIVFTMIWIAWVNGSIYLELHGREDGRTRTTVFVQMGILALLAVFTGVASEDVGGARFALAYVAFLVVQVLLWDSVRRRDAGDLARFTKGYELGLVLSAMVILLSAFLPPDIRVVVWAGFCVAWLVAMTILGWRARSFSVSLTPTHSMVERFGLFVIIVLGEVVVGVVVGLSAGDQDLVTIGTGVLALMIGLGFWWIYFDIVGGRQPRDEGPAILTWMLANLPITLAIAAAGAGMVSLIEHAHDPVTPQATAWLLGGSVALVLLAQILSAWALADRSRLIGVYRPLALAMAVAAVVAFVVGYLQPAPWLLAAVLSGILMVLWFIAVGKFIREGAWREAA